MRLYLIVIVILPFLTVAQNNYLNFGTSNTLDIVTWNLEWFPKNGNITIDSLKSIIEKIDADIYAFQEIDNIGSFNTLKNQLSGYSGLVKNTSNLNLAFLYKNSITIDSSYSILDDYDYVFAGRTPFVLEINYNGMNFNLFNNHFKCCGDGVLDLGDSSDEENRRLQAMNYLKNYIDNNNYSNAIILGDLNDLIEDNIYDNIFISIINDSLNWKIVDDHIPNQITSNWSFPNWPSHLDHIFLSNSLLPLINDQQVDVKTIRVDNYFQSFYQYDNTISDHLPVGLRLNINPSNFEEIKDFRKTNIEFFNLNGQRVKSIKKGSITIRKSDRKSEKIILIKK
ncbi:endonuclease/exonuclease/phosphatase family protein [Bacteroidota bacterium]|nr:endonuclease/exonuclease/phosphatase family protein [Bacteroidota bacterium]